VFEGRVRDCSSQFVGNLINRQGLAEVVALSLVTCARRSVICASSSTPSAITFRFRLFAMLMIDWSAAHSLPNRDGSVVKAVTKDWGSGKFISDLIRIDQS
jgi:hypothetical protein